MAANWTLTQVLNQLDSGAKWSGSTITYAFPSVSAGMLQTQGERAGFQAVSAAQRSVFIEALQNWDDLIQPNFQQNTAKTTDTPSTSDLEFGYSSTGVDYAHAYYPTDGSAWFLKGSDVSYATPGSYGFTTIMHEMGHALGLNHMGNYNGAGTWTPSSFQDSRVLSIMSYFGPSGGIQNAGIMDADWTALNNEDYSPQTPMLNDVYAIQQIYGVSTTTRTGNTVYGFSSNVTGTNANLYNFTVNLNPVLTIYDSGGTDTLDLSGWNTPSTINLKDGVYSSCNNMTNNIVIAYGCIIENVVGGGGNDVLTGNDGINQLDGGLGNDTLTGGAGSDSIFGGDGQDTAVFSAAFASYSISYNAATGVFSLLGLGTDSATDLVSGVETFQFSDVTKSASQVLFSITDTTAPTLVSAAPADNTTDVPVGTNITLTFNENVQAGTGNILIVNGDGTVAQTIAVSDAAQVTFSGSTVTINPTADLAAGSSYYVSMASGVFKDTSDNNYAGIASATALNFATAPVINPAAPTLVGTSPADDTTDIPVGANITLSFSKTVQAGAGNILIYNDNGTVAQTIAVTDTSQVTFTGNTVTVNPSADLSAGSSYYINVASGVFIDADSNNFAGISSNTAFNFSTTPVVDNTAPTLVSTSPADNATGILVGADISLTFSETVQAGTGDILIYNANGTVAQTIAVTDTSQVSFSGSTVTINPTANLTAGSSYYVNMAPGVFMDAASNNYAGIAGTTTFDFTTEQASTTDDFPLDPTTTTGIVVVDGSATPGTIETADDGDLFKVDLVADTTYIFSLTSSLDSQLDPFLQLYSPPDADDVLTLIASDDDSGGSFNSRISYTASTTETYYLVAWDYSTGTGTYTISAETGNAMAGGRGNNIYDVTSIKDVVIEYFAEGNDLVRASISYTLPGNVEKLMLTGFDDLDGTGNELSNTITGNPGSNILDGGTGADIMKGGDGDDFYFIDNGRDKVIELGNANAGIDEIYSSVSYKLGNNLENLILLGNAEDNLMGFGNALDNQLYGDDGNNTLDGGKGFDSFDGGAGDDTYLLDSLSEAVTELADSGADAIMLKVNTNTVIPYVLGDNLEVLILTGTGKIDITGNASNNLLIGNAKANALSGQDGDDTLDGGKGADTLTGGNGADLFIFDTAIKGNNDAITDFVSGTDILELDHAIFTSLEAGTLADFNENIFYDDTTGALYYDADGNGAKAPIQFATLSGNPALVASDLYIV